MEKNFKQYFTHSEKLYIGTLKRNYNLQITIEKGIKLINTILLQGPLHNLDDLLNFKLLKKR